MAAFLSSYAQISVESFRLLPNDMTATSLKGRKLDQNGKVCALIKVVTTETDFTFDGGSLGIVETAQKPGEIWVWVPSGLRRITVSHTEFEVLRDYYLNLDIEEGRTYEMRLKTPKKEEKQIQTLISSCMLDVKSDSEGDEVFINDTLSGVTPLNIKLSEGRYRVKVKRGDIEETKTVAIDKEMMYMPLYFNFSKTIDIKTDRNGDIVLVDGQNVGYSPARIEIPYGTHTVRAERIRPRKYEEEEIVVDKNSTQRDLFLRLLTPQQHFTREPLVFATLNYGGDLVNGGWPFSSYRRALYGFSVGSVHKVGWFVSAMSRNFFDKYNKSDKRMSFMGGFLVKMGRRSCFRMGAGYGRVNQNHGLDFSLGLQYNNKSHLALTFEIVPTFDFSSRQIGHWESRLGIGYCMHKKKLFKEN